jgi:hypothetical protein
MVCKHNCRLLFCIVKLSCRRAEGGSIQATCKTKRQIDALCCLQYTPAEQPSSGKHSAAAAAPGRWHVPPSAISLISHVLKPGGDEIAQVGVWHCTRSVPPPWRPNLLLTPSPERPDCRSAAQAHAQDLRH